MFVLPGSRVFAWVILGIGATLLGAATVLDFRLLRGALVSGWGRYGVGTTLMISLLLGICLLVNALSISRYHRFDFTDLSQLTLTSQTRQVLADLDKDVEVVSLFAPEVSVTISGYARDLLAEYRAYTDHLAVKEIDPDLQPDEARRYGLDQTGALLGAVIFRSDQRQRQVLGPQIAAEAEHAFTSALLEVTGKRQKKVYFLTGHGEGGIDRDYQSAKDGLADNLFDVRELDLRATPAVPEDAAAVVIAGPRTDLSPGELDGLRAFLRDSGHLMLLIDPDPPQTYRRLASEWWIRIDDGAVIDPVSFVAPYRTNPLVPRTRNSLRVGDTFFIGATATLPVERRPAAAQLAPLVWTSDQAWLEKGGGLAEQAVLDPAVDTKGPLAFGALVFMPREGEAEPTAGTRLVVIGDSDFAANRNFRNGENSALFLTAVNWLAADERIISIDRKVLETRRLLLNPEQARFLHLSSIGLLPLLLLIAGAYVWWRRRQS
jgi:ABC-type uncharacterized transport system involved in gliding motility auxiliary subunit